METLIGQRLANRYDIQAQVGQGGMGVVYRGYDTMLRRTVAVKVLPLQLTIDPAFVQRFQQEAVTAANLRHPNIVTIYDVGAQPGERPELSTYYIVMEYLEGVTLDQWLVQNGPLAPGQASHVVSQVAEALDYAHEQEIIHRDIKPSNVMISPKGKATLMDFGLVRAGEGTGLTRSSVVMGTPDYMAPEQALGQPIDWRADIYALGAVIYKLLTGSAPFVRTTPMAIAVAHAHEPPMPPRALRPDLPKAVEAVVMKALAKKPAERYQRAGDLAKDLALAVTGKMPAGLKALPTPAAGTAAVAAAAAAGAARPSPSPLPGAVQKTQLVDRTPAPASDPKPAAALVPPAGAQAAAPARRSSPAGLALAVVAVLAVIVLAGAAWALSRPGRGAAEREPAAAATTAVPAVVLAATDTPTAIAATATSKLSEVATSATTPTRAATRAPTATSTPAARPTATSQPTSTPTTARQATATSRPTDTPTKRPATATPTRKPPTATASQATATPQPAAGSASGYQQAPVLVSPGDGASAAVEQSFSWRWDGPALAADERFDWRLLRGRTGEDVVDARAVRESGLTYEFNNLPGGDYYWSVRVIRVGSDGRLVSVLSPESSRLLVRRDGIQPTREPTETLPPPEATETMPPP